MAAHQNGPAIRAGVGLPVSALWTVVGGGVLGLVATYWDDGWHTEIGRDSALIPPHLLLYVSIGVVGAVLAGWVLTVLWRTRSVRVTLATPDLALAVVAGVVTAGAAPADAAWHTAFGRDSVLWSPPHLLSVIGTAVLVVARRAGQVVTAPLTGHSTQFNGEIVLPSRGLWFVYAELRAGGNAVETWLPVRQDQAGRVVVRRTVYLPAGAGERPVGEFVAGGGLLAVGAGLIGWAGVAVRRRQTVAQ